MEFIKWDESFETNLNIIDQQHKVLIKKANQLYEHILANSFENINILLDELLEYAFYHFETEENYFSAYSYTDKENHIKEHDVFRNYINNIPKDKIYSSEFNKELFDFLYHWITHHMMKTDMKYAQFFKEKKLK